LEFSSEKENSINDMGFYQELFSNHLESRVFIYLIYIYRQNYTIYQT